MTSKLKIILDKTKNVIGERAYLASRRSAVVTVKTLLNFLGELNKLFWDGMRYLGIVRVSEVRYLGLDDSRFRPSSKNGVLYAEEIGQSDKVEPVSIGMSVVTLSQNAERFLEEYLEGLYCLPNIPTQLIFIDHNSSDKSLAIIEKYKAKLPFEFTIIEKDFNDRYSISNNEGIAYAKYDNILFLNNDVVITHRSRVDLALDLLMSRQEVGLIGWNLFYDFSASKAQHVGISFLWDGLSHFYRPRNIINTWNNTRAGRVIEYPAVTAAMLLARKSDLISIGGFDENYDYGFEDVDLCLTYLEKLSKKSVVIEGLSAVHAGSKSQGRQNRGLLRQRRQRNARHFVSKFGLQLSRHIQKSSFKSTNVFNLQKTTVGFVVTEAFDQALAGDYFTALELANALQSELDCEVLFFPQRGPKASKKISCNNIDLLIVMIDRYDLRNLTDRTTNTIVVAWMRNWFDRWHSWEYFHLYDFYLASSEKAQSYMLEKVGVKSQLLRIGTNTSRFGVSLAGERDIDICFVGNKWGVERDIEQIFPDLERYETHIIGRGWPSGSNAHEMFKGEIRYTNVPGIYSRSKIVIDDAASSTNKWASVNSRVFDALAAGCLVITNGVNGAKELLEESDGQFDIPSYRSVAELRKLIEFYLSNESVRLKLCTNLQKYIFSQHSYSNRSKVLLAQAQNWTASALNIAIKVAAPCHTLKHQWGDFHFAESLKLALQQLGHRVRVDILPEWYGDFTEMDEVVIVVRGLSEYIPRDAQVNIMWNISHPDKVSDDEYAKYDTVFVASNSYSDLLADRLKGTEVRPLLQCTDPYRFYPDYDESVKSHELLFVGNSRRIYRDVVKHSIDANLPISVYGGLWEDIIPNQYIVSDHISNTQLRKFYSRAGIVLNDHWQSMRENGFISNRLFDVAACGGVVVSDNVSGIESIFADNVFTYDGTKKGLLDAIERAENAKIDQKKLAELTASQHSFKARAQTLLDTINTHYIKKMRGWHQLP